MEPVVIFHPRVSIFSEPVRSPTFQELGTLASVLSPSLGRCLARTEPWEVAVDGFRGLGVFLVPALEKVPCAPPSSPAGEPAQMVPGGDLGSFLKPEMGAGAYLGGGGRKPVLGLEARCYHRNQSTGGLCSARWGLFSRQTLLEPGFPSQFPSTHSWWLRASGWWQKSCFRNSGFKPGTDEEKSVLPAKTKQTNPLCGPFSLKSQVSWAVGQKKVPWGSLSRLRRKRWVRQRSPSQLWHRYW